jgi:hypothetical protein
MLLILQLPYHSKKRRKSNVQEYKNGHRKFSYFLSLHAKYCYSEWYSKHHRTPHTHPRTFHPQCLLIYIQNTHGCLTSTCTTSSSLEKRNGLSLRSLFKELSWIDENRKARLWSGMREWVEEEKWKFSSHPFLLLLPFLHLLTTLPPSHRRPTFNLCSNDRFECVYAVMSWLDSFFSDFFFLSLSRYTECSKINQLPKICCCCCTTRQRRRWQKLCPFILSAEKAQQHNIAHTHVMMMI